MPLTIADLLSKSKTKTISIDLGADEPLEITFRLDFYTPRIEKLLGNMSDQPASGLANVLSNVITSWNLRDGKKPAPVAETLEDFDADTLSSILNAIFEGSRPNP